MTDIKQKKENIKMHLKDLRQNLKKMHLQVTEELILPKPGDVKDLMDKMDNLLNLLIFDSYHEFIFLINKLFLLLFYLALLFYNLFLFPCHSLL